MQSPKLEKRPKKHKFHSHEIEDDYNYLEDGLNQGDGKYFDKKIHGYLALRF